MNANGNDNPQTAPDRFEGILKSIDSFENKPAEAQEQEWPYKYQPTEQQLDQVNTRFSYHPPKADQVMRYQQIRMGARATASLWLLHCPESRELSLALTKLQEAVMWANAAIACNE